MALAAVVDYWHTRQRTHSWRAIAFGTATLVANVLGFELVYRFAGSVFVGKADKVHYWKVGGVLFVVTLVMWAIRILAQVFLAGATVPAPLCRFDQGRAGGQQSP